MPDAIATLSTGAQEGLLPGRPIVIGGDGRSGTTLLNVVLDSHPHLAVGPELHFNGPHNLGSYVLKCIELIVAKDPRVSGKALADHPDLKPGVQFVRRVERAGVSIDDIGVLIPKAMRDTASDLSDFPDRCALIHEFGELLRARAGKARYGFKIMREIRNVARYAAVWPGAQFIHIVRDGRDVAASQMLEHGSWGYNDIQTAAEGWANLIARTRENSAGLPLLEIRYEDLVIRPEPTLRRILEFLEEPWHEAVLRHHEVEHVFFGTRVNHPSRRAAKRPINASAVGRYLRDLPADQVEEFERIAGDCLIELGYLERGKRPPRPAPAVGPPVVRKRGSTPVAAVIDAALPIHGVRLSYGAEGCRRLRNCSRMVKNAQTRLIGKYLGAAVPCQDQIVDAVIDLRDLTWDEYLGRLKKHYKGNVVRDARKSDKAGFLCKPFVRAMHVPDLVEINHSKSERCGKPMRDDYLKSVEDMGGPPNERVEPKPPECPRHYDMWWGVFAPRPGHRQGKVTTDERLIAYIDLRRIGSIALYSLIIGHGDFLEHGIMYRLHFEIMQWILKREDEPARGLEFLMYAGFNQGGDGLKLWKKKTLFEPAHLVVTDSHPPPPPATARAGAKLRTLVADRGLWRKIRNLIR